MSDEHEGKRRPISWTFAWVALGFVLVLLEGIGLGRPGTGDTLSEALRDHVRFDPIGRFVLLPLWTWLTWHWILRPPAPLGVDWRDATALAIGIVWAGVETWLVYHGH